MNNHRGLVVRLDHTTSYELDAEHARKALSEFETYTKLLQVAESDDEFLLLITNQPVEVPALGDTPEDRAYATTAIAAMTAVLSVMDDAWNIGEAEEWVTDGYHKHSGVVSLLGIYDTLYAFKAGISLEHA